MGISTFTASQGSPYDNWGYVLDYVRALINDVMEDTDGDIFTNDWPASFKYINIAKRMVEQELADNGVEFNIQEFVIGPLPAGTQLGDPTVQVWLNQEGFFDGTNNNPEITLPSNILFPIRIWERFAANPGMPYTQCTPAVDGLPSQLAIEQQFRFWDYRADGIYFPQANQVNQIRLRAVTFSPEATDPTGTVPYRRAALAIAFMTAFVFANARGAVQAAAFKALADEQIDDIVTQTVRRQQRRPAQKRPYGGRGGRGRFLF